MLLVLRALLVVGLATLPHAAARCQQRDRPFSVKLGNRTGLKGKTIKLALNSSVHSWIASRPVSPISHLSVSPWTYIEDCVESRVPMKIYHAKCLTSGCLSQTGGEDLALEAKPIYYQVLVLHRQMIKKKSGKKKYRLTLGTEVIPVGCTCVRPSVIPQQ